MNNRTLLLVALLGGVLVLLAVHKRLPGVFLLPLVVPLFWNRRKE